MRVKTLRLSLLTALLVVLNACKTYTPPRPEGLPSEAVYAGGEDGGDWIACQGAKDGSLHCRIFDLRNGRLEMEAWFRYCPQLGIYQAGKPQMLDAEGLLIGGVKLMQDRRSRVYRTEGETEGSLALREEVSEKYYLEYGVKPDCTSVK